MFDTLSFRYRRNSEVLKEEMLKMGFKQLFSNEENPNGYLVTTFLYPDIPQFVFDEFCKRLSDAGRFLFYSTVSFFVYSV